MFRASLDVSLLADGRTLLICRSGLHPLASLLSGGWLGLLITISGLAGLFVVAGGVQDPYWPLLAAPPLVIAIVGLAFHFGKGDPAQDHAFLIERLALMTEATPT